MMNSKVKLIARILLGLIFFVFGINKFLAFIPPLEYPEGTMAGNFINGLFGATYFSIYLAIIEISSGLLLLINRYVPVAILALLPVTTNIFLFHLTLDVENGAPAFLAFGLNALLIIAYKSSFTGLLENN